MCDKSKLCFLFYTNYSQHGAAEVWFKNHHNSLIGFQNLNMCENVVCNAMIVNSMVTRCLVNDSHLTESQVFTNALYQVKIINGLDSEVCPNEVIHVQTHDADEFVQLFYEISTTGEQGRNINNK